MEINHIFDIVIFVVLPTVITIGGYFLRNIMAKLDELEKEMNNKVTEDAVRLLMSDKIEPIKEDLRDIKTLMNKLYELQLKRDK